MKQRLVISVIGKAVESDTSSVELMRYEGEIDPDDLHAVLMQRFAELELYE